MKIAVYGAGSTGCYLGAQLSLAGFDTSLICRARIKQRILDNGGITLTDYQGNHNKVMPGELITELNGQVFDLVFVTLKCHQLPTVVDDLLAITDEQSSLIFMQNGIGSLDAVKSALARRQIYTGITPFNVLQKDNAVFHKGTEGHFIFEQFSQADEIQQKLAKNGFDCEISADIKPVVFGKLLLNINNALNAIADVPIKEELQDRRLRKVLAAAQTEWLAVCRAMGVTLAQYTKVKPGLVPKLLRLPNWLFNRLAQQMLAIDPEARSSMWEDIQAGRKTEIDYINGAIVRLGEQYGVATPINHLICEKVRLLEAGERVSIENLLEVV